MNWRSQNETHDTDRSQYIGGFGRRVRARPPAIDKALLAAPANLKDGATVIKWKADFTYDTLKKGTNHLVCYDKSGLPGQQPFMMECTSLGNLDRVAQNLKFEAMRRQEAKQALRCRREGRNPREARVRIGVVSPDGRRHGARSTRT